MILVKGIALPAASYYGHYKIVELLLKRGASRSMKNKYNYIPYQERKKAEIKELFSCENANNRLTKAIRKILKVYSDQDKSNKKKILTQMIDLENYEGIDKVKQYFDQSNDANDPKYILKAYTEQTGFYQRLNRTLARSHELNPNDGNQHQLLDFLNLICCHPSFRNYEFQDQAYRGMRMDADELKQYDIGAKIMMKSLIKFEKLTQHYIQYLL